MKMYTAKQKQGEQKKDEGAIRRALATGDNQ